MFSRPFAIGSLFLLLVLIGVVVSAQDTQYDAGDAMLRLAKPIDVANPVERQWGPGVDFMVLELSTQKSRSLTSDQFVVVTSKQASLGVSALKLFNIGGSSGSTNVTASCLGNEEFIQPIYPVMIFDNDEHKIIVRALRVGSVFYSQGEATLTSAGITATVGQLLPQLLGSPNNQTPAPLPTLHTPGPPQTISCDNLDAISAKVLSQVSGGAPNVSASAGTPHGSATSTAHRVAHTAQTQTPTRQSPKPEASAFAPGPVASQSSQGSIGGRDVTVVANASKTGFALVFGRGTNVVVAVQAWQAKLDPTITKDETFSVPTTEPDVGFLHALPYEASWGGLPVKIRFTFQPSSDYSGCIVMNLENSATPATPQPDQNAYGAALNQIPITFCQPASLLDNAPAHYQPRRNLLSTWFAILPQQISTGDSRNLSFIFRERRLDVSGLHFRFDTHGSLRTVYGSLGLTDAGFRVTKVTRY